MAKTTATNGSVGTNRIADISPAKRSVQVSAPNMQVATFKIRGTTQYCQNRFSNKAREMMKAKQEAGSTGRKGTKREAKNFKECYEQAQYKTAEGWHGIPAASFRAAMVSACRLVGFKMTHAKLAVFVLADGIDADDKTQLVRITKGKPEYAEHCVRNESGVADIRPRPMWDAGWEAVVRVRFDGDVLTVEDIANLMSRVGMQIGIGEGRPDSKNSCGMGWGCFDIVNEE